MIVMYDLSITPPRITTVILHTFAMLYRTLSVTSNTLSWTKASARQTVANNATVTLIALLILYAHICVKCHA